MPADAAVDACNHIVLMQCWPNLAKSWCLHADAHCCRHQCCLYSTSVSAFSNFLAMHCCFWRFKFFSKLCSFVGISIAGRICWCHNNCWLLILTISEMLVFSCINLSLFVQDLTSRMCSKFFSETHFFMSWISDTCCSSWLQYCQCAACRYLSKRGRSLYNCQTYTNSKDSFKLPCRAYVCRPWWHLMRSIGHAETQGKSGGSASHCGSAALNNCAARRCESNGH